MRERMFVELIIEGTAQRDGGKAGGIEIVDAAALLAGGIARRLQGKLPRSVRQKVLRESRCCRGNTAADQDENSRNQRQNPVLHAR
jgi:hypothetical protein